MTFSISGVHVGMRAQPAAKEKPPAASEKQSRFEGITNHQALVRSDSHHIGSLSTLLCLEPLDN